MRKLPSLFSLCIYGVLLIGIQSNAQTQQKVVCDQAGNGCRLVNVTAPTQAGDTVSPTVVLPTVVAPASAPAPSFVNNISATVGVLTFPTLQQQEAIAVTGMSLALSPSLILRQETFLGQNINFTAYFGDVIYNLPLLGFVQKASNLNAKQIQFYVDAGGGIDRFTPSSTGILEQHDVWKAGGGLNYDPAAQAHFNTNLFEVNYASLPGISDKRVVLFQSTLTFHF